MTTPAVTCADERAVVDVTVVVPVKDRAALLAEALAGVTAQTVRPAAVIVVDDGSSDDSGDVARRWGATVLRNDVSQRQAGARNRAMTAATSTWIAFLDDDDVWDPDHLESLLRAAEAAGDPVLVTAPGRTSEGGWRGNPTGRDVRLDPASFVVPGEGLLISGTMVRRDAALAVGGFPAIRLSEDFALWLALLDRGPGLAVGRPTVTYRLHPGQVSLDAEAMRTSADEVVRSFADRPWCTPRLLRRWQSRLVWDRLRAAQFAGRWGGVTRGLLWYAAHPDALPALAALLRERRQGRRAATPLT